MVQKCRGPIDTQMPQQGRLPYFIRGPHSKPRCAARFTWRFAFRTAQTL